jgi:LacI family transcriptional regulator
MDACALGCAPLMTKKKAPTIRTVAAKAGVGVGTVSRVLNGGPVSPELAEKVMRAVSSLAFTPHPAARGLANRQAYTIGLVVNSIRGSWFSELIAGVEEALLPSRRSVVIGTLRLTGKYDASVIHAWLQERRVDGILFVRCSKRELPLLEAAKAKRLPVALIAPDAHGDALFEVHAQNVAGGEIAAKHLWDLGHRRIAFLGGPRVSRDTQERLKGVKSVFRKLGGETPDPVWFATNYYTDGGHEVVERFLKLEKRPTAVVCASDALALGFAKGVLDAGLRIPDDVSLIGFDNSPEGEMFWPGLTSIAQPSREMARAACEALVAHLDGKAAATKTHFDMQLCVRESTRAI